MRYELGFMDKYPIEAAGSTVENNPMYRVALRTPIDAARLESAIRAALPGHPLFATRVCFDKAFYLETNDAPLVILQCDERNRPKTFGQNTNDYPWRICYDGCRLCFEWLHGVSDGIGALKFLSDILCVYCGGQLEPPAQELPLGLGLEPFYNAKEKGSGYAVDPTGFPVRHFPKCNRGYKTDCHALTADTASVVAAARAMHSSVAPVLAILFSRALRCHLPAGVKNRKVACNVVLDLRRSLHYETMHNCVDYKRMTYIDDYDAMSFAQVAQTYKEKLDVARRPENVVRSVTDRIKTFRAYHLLGSKRFLRGCTKLIGLLLKDTDCNFVLTYPGKIELPSFVSEQVADIDFKVWHDFGECIMAAVDYNGRFNLNIAENYVEKGVVEDFIRLSAEVGIIWQDNGCTEFEQAHFMD